MQENKFLTHILTDIKVKLEAEFKENFTRKVFFNEKWKNTKSPNSRGSLMLRHFIVYALRQYPQQWGRSGITPPWKK